MNKTLCEKLAKRLLQRKWTLATAESCTGGGLAFHLTAVPGSSHWFKCAYVTYTNEAKHEMLGVSKSSLLTYGAVSHQVAIEMAEGALKRGHVNVAMSITGVAGPSSVMKQDKVGTVFFAIASQGLPTKTIHRCFPGDRSAVREAAIDLALHELLEFTSSF